MLTLLGCEIRQMPQSYWRASLNTRSSAGPIGLSLFETRPWQSSPCRSTCRARERRDMTVPIGTSMIRANVASLARAKDRAQRSICLISVLAPYSSQYLRAPFAHLPETRAQPFHVGLRYFVPGGAECHDRTKRDPKSTTVISRLRGIVVRCSLCHVVVIGLSCSSFGPLGYET